MPAPEVFYPLEGVAGTAQGGLQGLPLAQNSPDKNSPDKNSPDNRSSRRLQVDWVNGSAGGLRKPINSPPFLFRPERAWAEHTHVQVALPAYLILGDRPKNHAASILL